MATKQKKTTTAVRGRLLADRVLIKQVPRNEKTASGIIIPDFASDPKDGESQHGEVVLVGPGYQNRENGVTIPPQVKVGDTVIYGKYSGTAVHIDGTDYTSMRESDIIYIY